MVCIISLVIITTLAYLQFLALFIADATYDNRYF